MSWNARRLRTQAAALVLASCLVGPSIGHAKPANVVPPGATALSTIDIRNFGRISASYYRGAEPHEDDYADLAALGIKTLVDLRGEDSDPQEELLVHQAGMKYVHIPMTTRRAPSAAQVQEFLRVIDDPVNQPVFVHCVGGRHRTGVMTAVYRITREGWTADQAFKEMKDYDFGPAFLHPEFKKFVYDMEATRSAATATN